MYIFSVLIQIVMEQLRNKQNFIYFPHCIFTVFLDAISIYKLAIYYKNPPFELNCAAIHINIHSVDKLAISITTIIAERDFESEYLFRMCSIANNLMTSPEFRPVCSATVLCHLGRKRNSYVATYFIRFSSTA